MNESGEPRDGHTFRFIFDIRGSHRVEGDLEYKDAPEFDNIFHTFDVRAWSLREALAKATLMSFVDLMNEIEDPSSHSEADLRTRLKALVKSWEPLTGGREYGTAVLAELGEWENVS